MIAADIFELELDKNAYIVRASLQVAPNSSIHIRLALAVEPYVLYLTLSNEDACKLLESITSRRIMIKNPLGEPLNDGIRILLGDRVRVQFSDGKDDLTGDVIYIPNTPGDIWIILTSDRVNYVQTYSVISKVFR